MYHDSAIFALAFSKSSPVLCSADFNGDIKLWKYTSGKFLKMIEAHSK
jgi:WD40 repeat protein